MHSFLTIKLSNGRINDNLLIRGKNTIRNRNKKYDSLSLLDADIDFLTCIISVYNNKHRNYIMMKIIGTTPCTK